MLLRMSTRDSVPLTTTLKLENGNVNSFTDKLSLHHKQDDSEQKRPIGKISVTNIALLSKLPTTGTKEPLGFRQPMRLWLAH